MHWHITSAADENYICHIATLLHSITTHKPDDATVTFHLLSNGVSENSLKKLQNQVGDRCDIEVYDISNLRSLLPSGIPDTIAITAYARLLLADIIPVDVKTLLYVDCDTILNKSLAPLFKTDITNFLAAGVLDTLPDDESKIAIGLKSNEPYYNSGVILINLDLWRKENIKESFLNYLISQNGKVHHHDQGIINHVLKGRFLTLPVEYNLTSNYLSHPYAYLRKRNTPFYSEAEVKEGKKSPVIIHYTEGFLLRPWVAGSHHPLKHIYLKHRSYTNWKDTPLLPDKRPVHVKIQAFAFLHLHPSVYHLISHLLFLLSTLFKKKNNN